MPFEAAFGKKPNLKSVCEWGEKVYVRIKGGMKLGGRVREGRWLGIDNESKGAQVYWPGSKMVTVERNIYYDNSPVSCLEEEQELVGLTKTVAKDEPLISLNLPAAQTEENPDKSAVDTSDVDLLGTGKRIRKPSKKVVDLLKGSKGALAPGIQKPSDDWAAVVVGCIDEYAFVAEIGAAEALKPRSLAEAKSHPDWLLWEKAAEDEMKSLRDAETWEVVEMPKDVNVIGSKWVFKAKKDAAGAVV